MTCHIASHHSTDQALTFADGEHPIRFACFLVCRESHGKVREVWSNVWVGLVHSAALVLLDLEPTKAKSKNSSLLKSSRRTDKSEDFFYHLIEQDN